MKKPVTCPHCGKEYSCYRNPTPTVDVVIYHPERGIVIIKRKNIPHGYALPGGYLDYGEQAEHGALREMKEETNLDIRLMGVLGVYSRPDRDPRQHNMSVVFVGEPINPDSLKAGDDAGEAKFYKLEDLPSPLVFDHARIIEDFRMVLAGKRNLAPIEPMKS